MTTTTTEPKTLLHRLRVSMEGTLEVEAPESVDSELLAEAIQYALTFDLKAIRLDLAVNGYDVSRITISDNCAYDDVNVEIEETEVVDEA